MPTATTIPITPGSGINLDAEQLTVGSNTVARENICIADPSGATSIAAVKAASTAAAAADPSLVVAPSPNTAGFSALTSPNALPAGIYAYTPLWGVVPSLSVAGQPSLLFQDTFDGTVVDTFQKWVQTTVGSTSITVGSGFATFSVGTAASNALALATQCTFLPKMNSTLAAFGLIQDTTLTGSHRFFGFATVPASWAATTPVQDGAGFEITTTGALNCCVYAGGTEIFTQAITTSQIAYNNGASHTYAITFRGGMFGFYIDNFEVPLAETPPSINVVTTTLPARVHIINGTTALGFTPTFNFLGTFISDSGTQNLFISDGSFPFRKTAVETTGALRVSSGIPHIIQFTNAVSSGSVSSLACTLPLVPILGHTFVIVCAVGNTTVPTVSDSNGITSFRLVSSSVNSTGFGAYIFQASDIYSGARDTITVTNNGAATSMAMEVYELDGLLSVGTAVTDQSAGATGNVLTAATATLIPTYPNEFFFAGVAVGAAADTITPATGWSNDSGQLNPATPSGLYSFVSMSQYAGGATGLTPSASLAAAQPWAIACVSLKPAIINVGGAIRLTDGTSNASLAPANTAATAAQPALVVATSPNSLVSNADGSGFPLISTQVGSGHVLNVVESYGSPLPEIMYRILLELKGIRLAVTALACEGGRNKESDFDPMNFATTGDEYIN